MAGTSGGGTLNVRMSSCSKVGIISSCPARSPACIGGSAFGICTGLIRVTIPNGVTNIGDWAFDARIGRFFRIKPFTRWVQCPLAERALRANRE
jgi:hypothetical protein